MQPRPFGITHVGIAVVAVFLSVWFAEAPPRLTAVAVLGGVALGTWAGVMAGRRVESRVDRSGGVVLYAEDSMPYVLLWPLAVLALLPFASGAMIRAMTESSDAQLVLRLLICGSTAAWLAHDVAMGRRLRRIAAERGALDVQWFHARSAVGPEGMIGKTGEVTSSCAPDGYVRVDGELWRAETIDGSSLGEGQRVIVRRLNGLVLFVEALERA